MMTEPPSNQFDARKTVYLTVFLALVLHGGLLPFTVGQTYDAYIHMFFGDHYHRSWFDPWEPRWYTGFTVTAYPPGSHQLIGLLLNFVPHRAAFILVQLAAVCILAVGIYRFSRLWASDMAASLAALLCVASTGIAETLHIFGQLPTTLSIGIFLNGTPHIYRWIHEGRKRDIPLSLIFTAGATAAHHVTPIFATLLFIAPLGVHAWMQSLPQNLQLWRVRSLKTAMQVAASPIRGIILGTMMLAIIILVVFPYWHWSITDPITQVSIPHGSRESFIARPDLGLIFFVIPWGLLILIVPYVVWCALRSRLWPLALSVLLCLFLGTGGTTPLPKLLLGPAFDILTLDRFTFWATLLIMPFAGQIAAALINGDARAQLNSVVGRTLTRLILAASAATYGLSGALVAMLPLAKPTQPAYIDPDPIVQFMAEDNHNEWRYLTLGFGDQFAYHSALIDGYSVDGNYHSARRLPQLTSYSVERLENSKYLGVPGLGSLQQFITNAEAYNLKFIFSNDEFYDPLLYYGGWTRLLRLRNGVVVWEKPGVRPLPHPLPRRTVPAYQALMWGIIPPASLFLVFATLITLGARGQLICVTLEAASQPVLASLSEPRRKAIRYGLAASASAIICLPAMMIGWPQAKPDAESVLSQHYLNLDLRNFTGAHALLAPETRPDYESYLKVLRSRGGLISSYSKLLDIEMRRIDENGPNVRIESTRTYLTAVGTRTVSSIDTLTKTDAGWRLINTAASKNLTDASMTRSISVATHDVSLTRRPDRGTRTSGPDRPKLTASQPMLINLGDRVRVVGNVTNISSQPACIDAAASARFRDSAAVKQHMGTLGAHRLQPGETRHYSLEFEGVLQLQDATFGTGFDPEFFRLPEFETNPDSVELRLSSLFCAFNQVSGLTLDQLQLTKNGAALNLTISNQGTTVASVVKLSLTYFNAQGHPVLVEPYYIETNLIPGEVKSEHIPLHGGEGFQLIRPLEPASVNSQINDSPPKSSGGPIALSNSGPFTSLAIEIDAIPFEPTF